MLEVWRGPHSVLSGVPVEASSAVVAEGEAWKSVRRGEVHVRQEEAGEDVVEGWEVFERLVSIASWTTIFVEAAPVLQRHYLSTGSALSR